MKPETKAILSLLEHGNQLKRTTRTGWAMRGVPSPENVAAHTYGTAYTAMILAPHLPVSIDMGKLLSLVLIHDLAEGLTTDIPVPAWRYLPDGVKGDVERGAMTQIVGSGTQADQLMGLWEEMHAKETAEAKLVHDADKLDMYLQVTAYEKQGTQALREFWQKRKLFHYDMAQQIYDHLRATSGFGQA